MSGAGEALDAAIEGMGGAGYSARVVIGDAFHESLILRESARSKFTRATQAIQNKNST